MSFKKLVDRMVAAKTSAELMEVLQFGVDSVKWLFDHDKLNAKEYTLLQVLADKLFDSMAYNLIQREA